MTLRGVKATWQCKVCLTEVIIESSMKTTQGILELLQAHEATCTSGIPDPPPLRYNPRIGEDFTRR